MFKNWKKNILKYGIYELYLINSKLDTKLLKNQKKNNFNKKKYI
jgi:hypothetical protein